MNIGNISNVNFGVKLNTVSVLETTSLRIIQNDGIVGIRDVVLNLWDKPFKATGNRGYKYMAEIIGEKIIAKYPEIANATERIKEIVKINPYIKKEDLAVKIKPIIDDLGDTVDIVV